MSWDFATASSSAHTLATPVTVAAKGTLTVTVTNDASTTLTSPAARERTYFKMPALTIAATAGAAIATTSPASDR